MTKRTCPSCGVSHDLQNFRGNGVRDGKPRFKPTCRFCESVARKIAGGQRILNGAEEALSHVREAGFPQSSVSEKDPSVSEKIQSEGRSPTEIIDGHKKDREVSRLKVENRRLIEQLRLSEERVKVLDETSSFSVDPIKRREKGSGLREATAVVMLSDLHVEEPVESEKVNGLNEYNLDIAAERLERATQGAHWLIDMHRAKFQIRDLILWIGGDTFSGYIHEELEETAQLSPIESILWLQRKLSGVIDSFLQDKKLEKIIVPCNVGNHSRTTKKKRISTGAENSYEFLMYCNLADKYKNEPRVQVLAPRSILLYLQIYNQVLRTTHGDSVKYGGGVGGIFISINKALANWDRSRRADITIMGHFHQYVALQHLAVNGSLIGMTPYSIEIKAAYEPPQQSFFLIDSDYGRCCSTPLWVADPLVQNN